MDSMSRIALSGLVVVAVSGLEAGLNPGTASAEPIVLGSNSLYMFRDLRAVNDVGLTAGDRLQYGANVVGGSANVTLSGFYAPQNLTDAAAPCSPVAVNQNFCGNAVAYASENPASVNFGIPRIAQPWSFTFQRTNSADSLTVTGPSVSEIATATSFTGGPFNLPGAVPFPTDVTISNGATPLTPVISWNLPAGYTPDGFRVQIYDKSRIRPNGVADVIHNDSLLANATSYTVPSILEAGIQLETGGKYAINFEVIETRGDVPFTGGNRQILSQSSSFFSFSPLDNTSPPNVFLPQVGVDPNPNDNLGAPYQFKITEVGPSSKTFIDPFVAIGYDYATGAGDPNFASVTLPNVGDGIYTLSFLVGAILQSEILNAGSEFFFPGGGVNAFSVRGIETGAGLDPANTTAFVTGLTFVTTGSFTGTMTPVIEFVPDAAVPLPNTLALLGMGLAGLLACRRKQ